MWCKYVYAELPFHQKNAKTPVSTWSFYAALLGKRLYCTKRDSAASQLRERFYNDLDWLHYYCFMFHASMVSHFSKLITHITSTFKDELLAITLYIHPIQLAVLHLQCSCGRTMFDRSVVSVCFRSSAVFSESSYNASFIWRPIPNNNIISSVLQWSFYFKSTHGTTKCGFILQVVLK